MDAIIMAAKSFDSSLEYRRLEIMLELITAATLAERLANLNLSKTLSDSVFTPAYGDIPTKEERDGLDSFNNLVSDTVTAEP
jgi:hypothetical protein